MLKNIPANTYPKKINLNNCDKEPIHLIGRIQEHGILISGLLKSKKITHCSENCERIFKKKASEIIELSLVDLFPISTVDQLFKDLGETNTVFFPFQINSINIDLIIHRSKDNFILEIEEVGAFENPFDQQLALTKLVSQINTFKELGTLNNYVTNAIKNHFKYDRVMIYQFDDDWN